MSTTHLHDMVLMPHIRFSPYDFACSTVATKQPYTIDQLRGYRFTIHLEPPMATENRTPPEAPTEFDDATTATIFIGQTPYGIKGNQLQDVLEHATGIKILSLRPQYRRFTNKRQVTGAWFCVVPKDKAADFVRLDRCIVLDAESASFFEPRHQAMVELWLELRDKQLSKEATCFARAVVLQHLKPKATEACEPCTIEAATHSAMLG